MDLISSKSFLLSKAKSMVSSLSGIILWSTGSALENPKPYSSLQREHIIGLKILICTEPENTHCTQSSRVSKPPKATSLSLSPSLSFQHYPRHHFETMDDLIGTDSGVHMVPASSNENQIITTRNDEKRHCVCINSRIIDKRRHHKAMEHYPPPISSATGVDRVTLTRHHGEGKLVIEGRISERHEHLESRREEGRLILTLVATCSEDHDDEGFDLNEGLESGNALGCGVFMETTLTCNASNSVTSYPAFVRPMTSVIM